MGRSGERAFLGGGPTVGGLLAAGTPAQVASRCQEGTPATPTSRAKGRHVQSRGLALSLHLGLLRAKVSVSFRYARLLLFCEG